MGLATEDRRTSPVQYGGIHPRWSSSHDNKLEVPFRRAIGGSPLEPVTLVVKNEGASDKDAVLGTATYDITKSVQYGWWRKSTTVGLPLTGPDGASAGVLHVKLATVSHESSAVAQQSPRGTKVAGVITLCVSEVKLQRDLSGRLPEKPFVSMTVGDVATARTSAVASSNADADDRLAFAREELRFGYRATAGSRFVINVKLQDASPRSDELATLGSAEFDASAFVGTDASDTLQTVSVNDEHGAKVGMVVMNVKSAMN